MLRFKSKLLFGAIASITLNSALAQSSEQPPAQIVVIANRVPVPLRQIGTSVSVIDEEALKAHGNFSLKDVLRQSTAIGVSSNGGAGATSSLRIRGEEGFRTLTLFDGLKLSDPSGPQVSTQFEHILSGGVSRVEVLRGPQGLSYGADAGGVISISSRTAEPGIAASVDAQAGSFGTEQLAATLSAANDTMDLFITGSDYQTDGYNARLSDTVLADKDGYENQSLHTRLGFNVSDNIRLQVVHRDVEGETEFDGCFAGTTVHDCDSIYDLQATRLSANYASTSFTHELAYSNTETNRDSRALGVSSFKSNGEIERWEYVGNATELPGFDLVFGVDLEQETNGALQRDSEGYYVEYLSDFSSSFFFTAGIRQDSNDDFGDHTSYRVSAAHLVDVDFGQLKFKASYGTGFRSPSLYEINYNRGSFSYPPASLVSLSEETSIGFEYGVELLTDAGLQLEMVVFDQDVEDAIYFDLTSFSGYLQDIGTSNSTGIELSGRYELTQQIHLAGNYTYNETERPDGRQRLLRPEHLANVGISYRDSAQKLNLHAFYRMSKDAIDEPFGVGVVPLDDFGVWDLSASYSVSRQIELYARLENAFDKEYREVTDYAAPERASYVGIRVNF